MLNFSTSMPYEIQSYANEKHQEVSDRKDRINTAENELIRLFFEQRNTGFFVDIGANHPFLTSKTYHLEESGWKGLLIEPIPACCDQLRKHRPGSEVVQVACDAPDQVGEKDFYVLSDFAHSSLDPESLSHSSSIQEVIQIQTRTLNSILEEKNPPQIDFISIDVEGCQLNVLKGFDLNRYRPRLLFVEDHLRDLETHSYLTKQGYRLAKRTVRNNWYIPADEKMELTCPKEDRLLWQRLHVHPYFRALRARWRSAVRKPAAA
ncbi:FkbM family methyltransferase [Calycomorphotria hydatis]|uniref:Methyltransferase FkbM domain-containing protein n=1 Tax=Calycomorphotria hydatis TaxID=2528027 RepID=A0A517T3S4_9PLAN|nr:FkbM family methyltransferase [Calycomorphotria hydatis]QDT63025.1 hypothetical protein V22_02240 [Calycomorphotria hydatis]